ncbi:hypothetical protein FB446DRAFT_785491 [Lentinula raphanica]|nr:hypothetical protein FB446DRAFT_785491 [Lentinula raphanica]
MAKGYNRKASKSTSRSGIRSGLRSGTRAASRSATLRAASHYATPQATSRAATPQATSRAATPRAASRAATPRAALRAATPRAALRAATPRAALRAATPRAASRAATPRAASRAATSRAVSHSSNPEAPPRSATPSSVSLSTSPPPVTDARWELRELAEEYPSYVVVPDFEADLKTASEDLVGMDTSIQAIYFGLEFANSQVKVLDSKTIRTTIGGQKVVVRLIDFRSEFAFDFGADKLYVALIAFGYRRFVVVGTYDKDLAEENVSLYSVGCRESYKGDIAVCFYGLMQRTQFLRNIPRLTDVDGDHDQSGILEKVVSTFAKNVRRHVEDGLPYKRVIRVY